MLQPHWYSQPTTHPPHPVKTQSKKRKNLYISQQRLTHSRKSLPNLFHQHKRRFPYPLYSFRSQQKRLLIMTHSLLNQRLFLPPIQTTMMMMMILFIQTKNLLPNPFFWVPHHLRLLNDMLVWSPLLLFHSLEKDNLDLATYKELYGKHHSSSIDKITTEFRSPTPSKSPSTPHKADPPTSPMTFFQSPASKLFQEQQLLKQNSTKSLPVYSPNSVIKRRSIPTFFSLYSRYIQSSSYPVQLGCF